MTEFEWMQSKGAGWKKQATVAMRENEILHRAALLARLGYPRERAEARLKQNAKWEHDNLGKPTYLRRLSELVAQAYGTAPSLKNERRRRRS